MEKPERPVPPKSRLRTFTPFVVIAVILFLLLIGLYLFPMFKAMMVYQDCVASGRMDCARDSDVQE